MAEYKQYITQIQENGNVMISEDVIAAIVEQTLAEADGVVKGGSDVVGKKSWGKGIRITVADGLGAVLVIGGGLAAHAPGAAVLVGAEPVFHFLGQTVVLIGAAEGAVWAAVRPEGFILEKNGPFTCDLTGVEVMGRDITVIATHKACENTAIRAIIGAENKVDTASATVRFHLKPNKVFLFSESGERIPFTPSK